jgi:hypothetical protein
MGGKKRRPFLSVEIRIRIDFGRLDPDPDPGKYIVFEVLDVLLGGLEASPVAWTSFIIP